MLLNVSSVLLTCLAIERFPSEDCIDNEQLLQSNFLFESKFSKRYFKLPLYRKVLSTIIAKILIIPKIPHINQRDHPWDSFFSNKIMFEESDSYEKP